MSRAAWVFAVSIVLLSGGSASAQEDFRSLDAGRPLKVTDAFPKKYLEWEFQSGLKGGWAEGGRRSLEGLFELETGLFRFLCWCCRRRSYGFTGSGGLRLGLLYDGC